MMTTEAVPQLILSQLENLRFYSIPRKNHLRWIWLRHKCDPDFYRVSECARACHFEQRVRTYFRLCLKFCTIYIWEMYLAETRRTRTVLDSFEKP